MKKINQIFQQLYSHYFWSSLKDITPQILINSQIKYNLQGYFFKENIPFMHKILNMSTVLCIRYALQIFRKILKALFTWWVKGNKGFRISARKAEILKSVRFAKYKTSNFWQRFKLKHNRFSSWVFACGFCFVFFHLSHLFFLLTSVPRAA